MENVNMSQMILIAMTVISYIPIDVIGDRGRQWTWLCGNNKEFEGNPQGLFPRLLLRRRT